MRLAALALAAASAPVRFSGGFLAAAPPPLRAPLPLRPRVAIAVGASAGEARFRRGRAVAVLNSGGVAGGSKAETGLTRSGLVKAAGAALAAAAVVSSAALPAIAAAGKEPEPEITSKAFIEVTAEYLRGKTRRTHGTVRNGLRHVGL